MTIPVLSQLDEKWCRYSIDFIERMAKVEQPWLLYHCTRGAHFDNYPHERFLGRSPARHPYKDTLLELDEIMGRLLEALQSTGQLEDTLIFVTSDNGPHMETWPDSAFTPFRCAKGSTWEGGVRVPGLLSWPGMSLIVCQCVQVRCAQSVGSSTHSRSSVLWMSLLILPASIPSTCA